MQKVKHDFQLTNKEIPRSITLVQQVQIHLGRNRDGLQNLRLNFRRFLRVVSTPFFLVTSESPPPLMPSSDVTKRLLQFMQKVKHDFQLTNKEIPSGNVYMIHDASLKSHASYFN